MDLLISWFIVLKRLKSFRFFKNVTFRLRQLGLSCKMRKLQTLICLLSVPVFVGFVRIRLFPKVSRPFVSSYLAFLCQLNAVVSKLRSTNLLIESLDSNGNEQFLYFYKWKRALLELGGGGDQMTGISHCEQNVDAHIDWSQLNTSLHIQKRNCFPLEIQNFDSQNK